MPIAETEPPLRQPEAPAPYQLFIGYDAHEDTYTFFAHNVPTAVVQDEIAHYRAQRLPVYTLSQPRFHQSDDADSCRACHRLVQRFFSDHAERNI